MNIRSGHTLWSMSESRCLHVVLDVVLDGAQWPCRQSPLGYESKSRAERASCGGHTWLVMRVRNYPDLPARCWRISSARFCGAGRAGVCRGSGATSGASCTPAGKPRSRTGCTAPRTAHRMAAIRRCRVSPRWGGPSGSRGPRGGATACSPAGRAFPRQVASLPDRRALRRGRAETRSPCQSVPSPSAGNRAAQLAVHCELQESESQKLHHLWLLQHRAPDGRLLCLDQMRTLMASVDRHFCFVAEPMRLLPAPGCKCDLCGRPCTHVPPRWHGAQMAVARMILRSCLSCSPSSVRISPPSAPFHAWGPWSACAGQGLPRRLHCQLWWLEGRNLLLA